MAVYKVIQDVEAEDRLLGPLTLKGFIYAGVAVVLAYLNFRLLLAGGPIFIKIPVVVLLSLPMALFAVLALPFGREQPTEVWLLSRVRFMLKPRKRIWNQSGLSNLVTITAPKKSERQLTKNLSENEVQNRLKALASTLDSRGWAVKNADVNLATTDDYLSSGQGDSDRLIDAADLAQDAPVLDVHASDDILDEKNNPTAQKFDQMMKNADASRKKQVQDRVASSHSLKGRAKNDFRFFDEHPDFVPGISHVKHDKKDVLTKDKIAGRVATDKKEAPESEVTAQDRADKLELIQAAKDYKVSTLANLANRKEGQIRQIGPGEMEISLH